MSFWTTEQQEIYIKARLRRAAAFLELGNLMQVERPSMGAAFDSQLAQLLLEAPSESWAASDELTCREESAGDEATAQSLQCRLHFVGYQELFNGKSETSSLLALYAPHLLRRIATSCGQADLVRGLQRAEWLACPL